MATYTVTNSFSADTTAIASQVNQNFTDVLTALNSFDAANLTGTIAVARISDLTTSQFATNVVDTDDTLAADSDTRLVSQSAVKSYIDTNTVQTVNTQTGAVATGATTLPRDDTIPQNTEGDEYMTLAITPTSATNKLKIEVTIYLSHSLGSSKHIQVALFQDSTANALAAVSEFLSGVANASKTISFTHYMTAGTAIGTTFKVRAGCDVGGTTTFNGHTSGRMFGGIAASSITIREIKV